MSIGIRPREELYIALYDLELGFTQREVLRLRVRWREGASVLAIAAELGRDPDEIAALIIDQARAGQIGRREGGLLGCRGLAKHSATHS